MNSIVELWRTNRDFLLDKKLHQILGFTGEGKLRDGNDTSQQFRDYLHTVPNDRLKLHADECLQESFPDNGLALQDIINEIGFRLGFDITHGEYRGKSNSIGFDGLWKATDGHSLVVEVKTTDAYRINLDKIAQYRKALGIHGSLSIEQSSVLIVVGRQDTGDLEAQIRGSRHAWDIRVISTDSLISLLALKEKLSDPRTLHQISEVLKPNEYTRIDSLIELMFTTAQDVELDENVTDDDEGGVEEPDDIRKEKKFTPVSFHEECAEEIQAALGTTLVKQSRSAYRSHERSLGLNLSISRAHYSGSTKKYWFAFHPHQRDFLQNFEEAYVGFGCGSKETIFLIPFGVFMPLTQHMWTTERQEKTYWHVVILDRADRFELQLPGESRFMDLSPYRLDEGA